MFETHRLKKAKAKLELESINKQLDEIESQKEQERWNDMPQWEKNLKTEILIEEMGGSNKENSTKYSAIMAGIWTVGIYVLLFFFSFLFVMPSTSQTHLSLLNKVINILFINQGIGLMIMFITISIILMTYLEIYAIYKRGYGYFLK